MFTHKTTVLSGKIGLREYQSALGMTIERGSAKLKHLAKFVTVLFLSVLGTDIALSQTLSLDLFQTPDGAITVNEHGDFVDPYFANRALTLADESGLNVRGAATPWISWVLPHQLPDGRFERYCKPSGGAWSSCQLSDADDAGLAVWLELLYRLSPSSGLRQEWQYSAINAEHYLESLYDKNSGLYFVSRNLKVCLLMDNVEIYHLFRVLAAANHRFGKEALSREYTRKAEQLAQAITRRLWSRKNRNFRASTQKPLATTFYPADVAQVYPWLFRMPTPSGDAKTSFHGWMNSHQSTWLERRDDDFPWGIVALTANKFGETASVNRWVENSNSLRHSAYWTVLDDTILRILQSDR